MMLIQTNLFLQILILQKSGLDSADSDQGKHCKKKAIAFFCIYTQKHLLDFAASDFYARDWGQKANLGVKSQSNTWMPLSVYAAVYMTSKIKYH